jgi:hypothetical protein
MGEILFRSFQILREIGRIPFRLSQILKEIREHPYRISEILDVFHRKAMVIRQDQERILQILEGIF